MNWPLRLRQWIEAIRMAGAGNVPWWGLVRAVLSGPVPRRIWRARLRYGCFQCPLFSVEHTAAGRVHLCRSSHPDMLGVGCGCFLPFLAMAAAPYAGKGCYGKTLADDIGWPVYVDRRWWPRRILDFLRGR